MRIRKNGNNFGGSDRPSIENIAYLCSMKEKDFVVMRQDDV